MGNVVSPSERRDAMRCRVRHIPLATAAWQGRATAQHGCGGIARAVDEDMIVDPHAHRTVRDDAKLPTFGNRSCQRAIKPRREEIQRWRGTDGGAVCRQSGREIQVESWDGPSARLRSEDSVAVKLSSKASRRRADAREQRQHFSRRQL
eukprot:623773-Prymnesium_polylepis.1